MHLGLCSMRFTDESKKGISRGYAPPNFQQELCLRVAISKEGKIVQIIII